MLLNYANGVKLVQRTTSRSFICLRNCVRHVVITTLAATIQGVLSKPSGFRARKHVLTICSENKEDDDSKGPFEVDYEEYESDKDIHKCRKDVEQDEFKCVVDSSASIQNAEDFARLAVSVEIEGKVE